VVETQEALSRISRSAGSIAESLDLEFEVILPKVVRLPEGTYSHQVETPLGIACWLLESRGDKYPHRLKLRPASLHTALALARVLVGASLETLPAIVASMPFIAGDVDR
jgi:NADH-quinone oxidoreductase subunit D